MMITLLSACSKVEYESIHTLYFKDSTKSDKATATFFNSQSGESTEAEMEKIDEDKNSYTFMCEEDCSVYNMAYVTCGETQTSEFAFNPCVSGWYKTEDDIMPFTYGEETDYTAVCDDVTLIGYGYEKRIHIWKPDNYDESSNEKYATVYLLDGEGALFYDNGEQQLKGNLVASEQINAMTSCTGTKAIIVAIENVYARDYELVPEIGESADEKMFAKYHGEDEKPEYDSMNGTEFADFVARTLVPYIQEHYHVYTDALHTAISGPSLGGLEVFYIGLEYPEIFGTVGAMSPSFWEYDAATWKEYLNDKSFSNNTTFLYLYTGPAKLDTDPDVTDMYNRLKTMGYPEEKLVLHFNEKGTHLSTFWRNIFSEFLTAMVFQNIKPLQHEN